MLEAIFPEEFDEEFFKACKYASYSSVRTRVVVLPNDKRYLIPDGCEVNIVNDSKPSISYIDKTFIFDNAPDDMLYFAQCYGNTQTVSIKSIKNIVSLVFNNLVDLDNSFLSTFSQLNESSKLGDLECSKYGYRFNRKTLKFSDEQKELLASKIFDNVSVKEKNTKAVILTNLSFIESKDTKGRNRLSIFGQSKEGENTIDYTLLEYGKNPLLKSIASKNSKLCIEVKDRTPIKILPEGLIDTSISSNLITPSKEIKNEFKIPLELFRIAYYEYILRKR